jgi:hypothetical protein
MSIKLTDPSSAYVGQTITIQNESGLSMSVSCATTGSTGRGQTNVGFQGTITFDTTITNNLPINVIRTYMYIGTGAFSRWIVLGC